MFAVVYLKSKEQGERGSLKTFFGSDYETTLGCFNFQHQPGTARSKIGQLSSRPISKDAKRTWAS